MCIDRTVTFVLPHA